MTVLEDYDGPTAEFREYLLGLLGPKDYRAGSLEEHVGSTRYYASRSDTGYGHTIHADRTCSRFPDGPVIMYPDNWVNGSRRFSACGHCTTTLEAWQ